MTTQSYDANVGSPFSQEAEEATIGSILIDSRSYISVAAFLSAGDFFLVRHQHIWRAFDALNERGETIDHITVAEQLENQGNLDAIGGRAYLIKMTNNIGTSVHAEVYARLVERTAIRRKLMVYGDDIKQLAMDEALNIDSVLSEAQDKIFGITSSEVDSGPVSIAEMLSDYYEHLEYGMSHQETSLGLPTGYRDLDALLGGYKKKALMTIGGRPGSGKSSWMLCNAANVCRFGGRVLVVSLEMDLQQFVERLLAVETGINTQRIAQLEITQMEAARITEAIGRLANWNMWFWAPGSLTPAELQQQSRRIKYEYGLDLLMVDYVQLMDAKNNSSGTNRVQEISYISRRMKQMARELNIPVVQLAQLSRAVEQRQDKRPVLSDLRESGCLTGDSLIYIPDTGENIAIKNLIGKQDFRVLSVNTESWRLEPATVTNAFSTGVKQVYEISTALGRSIRATANHKFLTIDGWKRLDELNNNDHIALPRVLSNQDRQTMSDSELALLAHLIGDGCTLPTHSIQLKIGINARLSTVPQNKGRDQYYVTVSGTSLYKSNLSRQRAKRVSKVVNSAELNKLATSDIYWDKVTSINESGYEEVYDLTVEPNHNFIANNIVVHNSLEQDSDIVMFLYRDEMYNEMTEFPNQAEVIVSKHRNGATGTIALYFEKSLTKFADASVHHVDISDLE